jgi:hypothetical protein
MAPCTATSAARSYDPRGQRTDDGRQRTDDRGQRTEIRKEAGPAAVIGLRTGNFVPLRLASSS